MDRRSFLSRVSPAVAGLALVAAGCSVTGSNTKVNPVQVPVKVDLSTAKQWSGLVAAAVAQFATTAVVSLQTSGKVPANVIAEVQTAVNTLTAVNATFQGVVDGNLTVGSLATSVINAVNALMTALAPIYPAVAAFAPEVGIALFVVQAFISAVAIVIPPVPASLTTSAAKWHAAH